MSQIVRVEDWSLKFLEMINEWSAKPFVWGATDCAYFAAANILAITGIDFSLEIRGLWNDEASSKDYINLVGGKLLIATDRMLKGFFEPCRINFSQRGDVVLLNFNGKKILGVQDTEHCWARSEVGLVDVDNRKRSAAWSIGHG